MTPLHPSLFVSYALAVLTGFCFGFVLERAGFGDARRLAAQFYLTDMRVLKVMFGAVATAAIGIALLRALGVLDWSEVYVNPTHLAAQAVGGAIFGVGFVVGGHCPGTAAVSCATGRINGLVFLVGVMLGALGFAGVSDKLVELTAPGGGRITLDEWLGLSFETTTLLVVIMALVLFLGAEYLEGRMARRTGSAPPDSGSHALKRGLSTAALALAALAAILGADAAIAKSSSSRATSAEVLSPSEVTPFDLAEVLREGPPDAVVWLKGEPRHAITGPLVVAADALEPEVLERSAIPGQQVWLAFQDGTAMHKLAGRLAARGIPVAVLAGGLAAWDRAMDVDPAPPQAGATAAAWQTYREQLALRHFFGGERAAKAPEVKVPVVLPTAPKAARKRREGC